MQVTTIDDVWDVVVAEPGIGGFFGLASMLEQTPHQTNAVAVDDTLCLKVDRVTSWRCCSRSRTPADMLTVLGRRFTTQQLVRVRASRIPTR